MGAPASETWVGVKARANSRATSIIEWYKRLSFLVIVMLCLVVIGVPVGFAVALNQPGWIAAGVFAAFLLFASSVGQSASQSVQDEAEKIEGQVELETQPPSINIVAEEGSSVNVSGVLSQAQGAVRSNALDQQEAILRKIYTEGLGQARASFRVSITFAIIGAGLLFVGIGLAIWHAPNGGQAYASIVSVTAGVVVNLVSSLFFVQSNKTRKDMATQGSALREESQEDRRFSGARELVDTIDDQKLRDNVKSQIAVSLMELGKKAAVRSVESGNGSSPIVSTPLRSESLDDHDVAAGL